MPGPTKLLQRLGFFSLILAGAWIACPPRTAADELLKTAIVEALLDVKEIGTAVDEKRDAAISDAQLAEMARRLDRVANDPGLLSLPPNFMNQVYGKISEASVDRQIVNSPGIHYTEHDGFRKIIFERFPEAEAVEVAKDYSALHAVTTTLATDFAGVMDFYLNLINDRYADVEIFRRNLALLLGPNEDVLDNSGQTCSSSTLCFLEGLSESFESNGNLAVALEFQRIAVDETARRGNVSEAHQRTQLLRLAELEARTGELVEARKAFDRLQALTRAGPPSPATRRRIQRLANRVSKRGSTADRNATAADPDGAADLVAALAVEQQWGQAPGWSHGEIANLMALAQARRISRSLTRDLYRALDTKAREISGVRACRGGRDRRQTLREVALLLPVGANSSAFCQYLFDRDVTRKLQRGRELYSTLFDGYYEFAVTVPFFNELAGAAVAMEQFGYRLAADTTRTLGVELLEKVFADGNDRRKFLSGLSLDVIGLFAGEGFRLAPVQPQRAAAMLGDALAAAEARFEKAWSGGAGSLESIAQDLKSPLASLADGWRGLKGASGLDTNIALDGAFRTEQLRNLNDTATALAAGLRRSALLDVEAASKITAGERRVGLAQHIARLQASANFEFNYGLKKATVEANRQATAGRAEVGRQLPSYAAFETVRPLSADEVAERLGENETHLLVVPTEGGCGVFVISGHLRTWHDCEMDAEGLRASIAKLRAGLDPQSANLTDANSFPLAESHRLYSGVFGRSLDAVPPGSVLRVVVKGPLAAVPLGVLLTEPPSAGMTYANAPWLLRRHAVAQLVQVADLNATASRVLTVATERVMVAVADPNFGSSDLEPGSAKSALPNATQFQGQRTVLADIGPISALPETALEVQAVAKSFAPSRSELLLGDAASEARVKSLSRDRLLERAQLLYFATHAVLPSELDGENDAGLLLSLPGTPTDQDDGLLSAAEISQLRLNTDLVVLSACNTAGGRSGDRSTFSGLAKSFLEAGARSVLVSHWPVVSDAAVEIMTAFFAVRAANTNAPDAENLRMALLSLVGRGAADGSTHPGYWAPFTVVGIGK